MSSLPFLTAYDPPGSSEGTLDPLGLYPIADQLAVALVPAVRERMRRVRLLTAMTIGALVTQDLDGDPRQRDASPQLAWEWLVVEALVRSQADDPSLWGVPGTLVTRRAIDQQGYLDARSYLKTPRVFGFNGVYKRLAVRLGLVDVHLAPGPNADALADAWARDLGLGGLAGSRALLSRWSEAVRRSLGERPPRTKTGWGGAGWEELSGAFAPSAAKARERRLLRGLLLATDDRQLGALPTIWRLQAEFDSDAFREELLHDRIEAGEPAYGALLDAIRAYEAFARSVQDAFDLLLAEAARFDARGYLVPEIAGEQMFKDSVEGLHARFAKARNALAQTGLSGTALQSGFDERFGVFGDPLDAPTSALALCRHHEKVQSAKSVDGKRPWFDRVGPERIYVRHAYRKPRRDVAPGRYVHEYRGWPIRRFHGDLS